MKFFNLVCVLALFTLCSADKLCRRSPHFFRASTFTYSEPIASERWASKYLLYPQLVPLLFGNFISNYKKANAYTCLLIRGHDQKIAVAYSKQRGVIVLTIVNHHAKAFPVRLARAKLLIYVAKKTTKRPALLNIRFVGPAMSSYRRLRGRNIYARALVKTLLDNARLVLGLGSCSSSLSSVSGLCNNPFYPHFGVTFAKQLRPWSGQTLKISEDLPNPRHISNVLCKSRTQAIARNKINLLMVMFGQFLDHDLVLTPSGHTSFRDGSFDTPPGDVGIAKMRLTRSDPLPFSPSKCCSNPYTPSSGEWNQYNRITSFIDAGTIYGSDHDRAMALRSFKYGKLIMRKTNRGEYLPRNSLDDLAYRTSNANDITNEAMFVSGDIRANENPVLIAFHTIFAREHNRICDVLREALNTHGDKGQSDEWLYQNARKIVIGELQNIVFNEFVPLMIGRGKLGLGSYDGYKPQVDASIDVMFSSAAYRWGHSALRNYFKTRSLKNKRKTFPLQNLFFNPEEFQKKNVEDWLLGAMDVSAGGIDLQHADSVRDFLFSPNRRGVHDLAAINIQRGRDHGLPAYLAARKAYGLPVSGQGMGDIPARVRAKILDMYKSVNQIDPFVGGLAEKAVRGALMGPFFSAVLRDQFKRLRDGDRFYYENVKWGDFVGKLRLVKKIKRGKVRLADVIKANTRIRNKHLEGRRNVLQTA